MDVKTMLVVARRVMGPYDLHERTGYPRSVPIPNQEAASRIVQDAADKDMFLDFVSLLLHIDKEGLIGRRYRIPRLRDILMEVLELGYSFDAERGSFVENAVQRKTKNWGVLREKEYYVLAFLRLDVVGSSELVRENSEQDVAEANRTLREIAQRAVHARNGRLWSWEGDGGMAAFYTDEIHAGAVHSAMEVLHELLIYNAVANTLSRPLSVRLAAHSGRTQYLHDYDEMNSDVIKRVMELESSYTATDSITISETVYRSVDARVATRFAPLTTHAETPLYGYAVEFAT
jgi:class 3 adenylate cyclase